MRMGVRMMAGGVSADLWNQGYDGDILQGRLLIAGWGVVERHAYHMRCNEIQL